MPHRTGDECGVCDEIATVAAQPWPSSTARKILDCLSEATQPLATWCVSRKLLDKIREFGADEGAQDVLEYGMLITTIAMVVLVGIAAFGNEIRPWLEQLAGSITTVST